MKYFLALAENHSITKTSLEFYTTHQSVSKIIRQLEEEMEAQLFARSSKGMTLTPEGEVLLPVARETVKAFQQVRLELAHMTRQKDLEGELLLWGTPISNAVAMPSLLSDFSALYPKVRYQIKEANTLDCMQYVSLHHNGLALVVIMHNEAYREIFTPYVDQVRLQPFMKDEYICVAGAQSPLAKRKTISIAELMQQPIAMLQTEINERIPSHSCSNVWAMLNRRCKRKVASSTDSSLRPGATLAFPVAIILTAASLSPTTTRCSFLLRKTSPSTSCSPPTHSLRSMTSAGRLLS